MIYLYSALLLHKTGKEINESNIKKVVEAAGSSADDGKIKALVAALHGVNIDEVIKNALAAQVSVTAPVPSGEEKPKAKEGPSEADKKKDEEQASAGLASLFG